MGAGGAHQCRAMDEAESARREEAVAQCVPAVAALVRTMRSCNCENSELEARFGELKACRFVSGVKREQMETIIEELLQFAAKSRHASAVDTAWVEHQDFFFAHGDKQMRTRVRYDSANMQMSSETIEKRPVSAVTCHSARGAQSHSHAIRVALKVEKPATKVAPIVNPTFVRIKQTRRFLVGAGAWAYDFSLTWSGATKTEAEESQRHCDPAFEIECELVKAEQYLRDHDDERVARSILLKMIDLLAIVEPIDDLLYTALR